MAEVISITILLVVSAVYAAAGLVQRHRELNYYAIKTYVTVHELRKIIEGRNTGKGRQTAL